MSNLNWYLAYSKPRQEAIAYYNLSRQGYEVFLPLISKQKIIRDIPKTVKESLFGRYIFVRTNPDSGKGLGPIRSTLGIQNLVLFGGAPQIVPDDLIAAIKLRIHENKDAPQKLFSTGDTVRITEGAFQGWEAIYQAEDAEVRALILLEMLGKTNSVSIPLSQLQKA